MHFDSGLTTAKRMINSKPFAIFLLLTLLLSFTVAYAETDASDSESVISNQTDDGNVSAIVSTDDGPQVDLLMRDMPESGDKPTGDTNDLLQRIRNGFGMSTLQSPYTSVHESWYAARPDYVRRMMDRSQLYLYHVVEEVQKRGMPTEVALLPMVESAFNPTAYSRSKASGIWQFIPSTGKNFGLKQNWWTDNRRDIMAATDAALNYLEKLHVMFGTWELALAAYNAGEGTVQHAIDRNRRKGLPTDYQSLQLPPETKNYVPKLQAVKNIVNNPEQFGLNISPIPNQPYFTRVEAPSKIDVKLAAKLAGVTSAEFTALNPAHNRPVMASPSGKQEILLPMGTEETFANNLANYDKPLVSWQTYQTKRGERLDSISNKFGISVAQLREVNDLPSKGRIKANQPLLVPANGSSQDTPLNVSDVQPAVEQEPLEPASKLYVVKKGDTVQSIAKRFGMKPRELISINKIKGNQLRNGQTLSLSKPAKNSPLLAKGKSRSRFKEAQAKGSRRYVVKRGETLVSIAKKFNVAAEDLQRWNNLRSSHLLPGRKLVILKDEA